MNARSLHRRPLPARSRGVTLVELMVASALGLLVALAVTTAVVSSGRQFSIISANATAQNSAQIGLSLLDLAGRGAGAGFYANRQPLCPTWNAYNGSALVSNGGRFMPARITDGGSAGASDTVVFTGGSGARALTAAPVMMNTTGSNIQVANAGAFADNDYALLGAPGSGQPCTLFQVTGAPTATSACGGNANECQVLVRNPNQGLNPGPTAFTNNPTFGFSSGGGAHGPATVSRVGSVANGFRQDAFTVQCASLVRYNAFVTAALPPCTAAPLAFGAGVDAIATDVVLMHAQYGVSNSPASDVVEQWVNASGPTWGGTPAEADISRIKAVRIVLVARGREPDGAMVSVACTNTAGVANTGPCSFEDAAAPVIDLSSVPVPAGRGWQNYRYRVHAAVIPLRTVIWSD
ncbi:PilW family protein [Ramlibacter tataouinensis]|uniref:Uncharacterized protein n=1 Tax=Ramlibacter tataouinensis (strain ATCC BAA-407 / DSM 14655 / LMG 21543 / TTB310) TaxID=365046 RepID=F5Y1R6_RAMTT|nr:PilW family protein [Ramlibacter tataouinensis]AEG92317.1 hypothetical protein Rta_12320 [Ramlibacter tataouinensis TTB310]